MNAFAVAAIATKLAGWSRRDAEGAEEGAQRPHPHRHTRVAPCLTRGQAHFCPVWPPLLAGYDRTLRVSHSAILPDGKVGEKPSPVSSTGRRERGGATPQPHIVILNMVQEYRLEPPRRHTRVAPCLTRGQAHFRPVWPPLLAGYDRTQRASHAGILPNGKVREKPSPVSSTGRREKGGGDAENRPNRYRIFTAIAPKPRRLSAFTPPHPYKTNT